MTQAAETVFDEMRELQVRRKHFIAQQVSIENRARGLILRALGWRPDVEAAESTPLKKRSETILAKAMRGKPSDDFPLLAADLEVDRRMREPAIKARAAVEKQMRKLARDLPVYAGFAANVRGFADLGLAVIAGECGDLANYATVSKVWKRLGLAPFNGQAGSTWRRTGGLTADEWTALGYSPKRLGQLYGVVTVPLFMAQRAGMPYREVYLTRRAHTAITHPEWSKKRSDNDARRIMTKALIADLWSAWPRASQSIEHSLGLRAADSIAERRAA